MLPCSLLTTYENKFTPMFTLHGQFSLFTLYYLQKVTDRNLPHRISSLRPCPRIWHRLGPSKARRISWPFWPAWWRACPLSSWLCARTCIGWFGSPWSCPWDGSWLPLIIFSLTEFRCQRVSPRQTLSKWVAKSKQQIVKSIFQLWWWWWWWWWWG